MKKLLIFTLFIFCTSYYLNAQVNPHTIGLRIGGNGDVNGAEISYQKGFSKVNRLELDLGFAGNPHYSKFSMAGIYHWVWNLTEGLNWYVGPGAGIGFYSYYDSDDYISIALGGQIGLEYDFNTLDVPILLSLDVRPLWDFLGDNSGFGWGTALGVRYTW